MILVLIGLLATLKVMLQHNFSFPDEYTSNTFKKL